MAGEVEKNDGKLTYDELKNVASQLSQQNQQLADMVRKANMANLFKRLDYLFKVVENKESFDSDFLISCVEEIKSIMTLPDNTETGKTEDEQA